MLRAPIHRVCRPLPNPPPLRGRGSRFHASSTSRETPAAPLSREAGEGEGGGCRTKCAFRGLIIAAALLAPAAALAAPNPPAPAQAPKAAAPVDLAFGAYQRGDYHEAMREAKKRVDDNPNDAAALTLIGRMYSEGAGVKRDAKLGADYFRRAADAGDATGAYLYGATLLANAPVTSERKLAKAYLEKAAAQNYGSALNLLGEMALENNGAYADFATAAGYFRRGAELGDADAAYALAELSRKGKGVEKNDAEARAGSASPPRRGIRRRWSSLRSCSSTARARRATLSPP
ncbi:MAG TPA: tetratricopeptide repeat protein [Methylocystis sp.]|nr:tetratricopeptide repeat protein [Methylocystis sp.]